MCFFGVPLQTNRENEFYSKLADLHLEKYNFPVEMIICLPNGTVVRSLPLQFYLVLPARMYFYLQSLKWMSRSLSHSLAPQSFAELCVILMDAVTDSRKCSTKKSETSVFLFRDRIAECLGGKNHNCTKRLPVFPHPWLELVTFSMPLLLFFLHPLTSVFML